jgi:hypothetical protein
MKGKGRIRKNPCSLRTIANLLDLGNWACPWNNLSSGLVCILLFLCYKFSIEEILIKENFTETVL